MMVDYERGMTVKSCKYGEYGSFEHLLFLCEMYVNIVLCQGTCDPVCFKFGMLLNTTELFDSSLNDIDIHSRSQGCGESQNLCCNFFVTKLHEAT